MSFIYTADPAKRNKRIAIKYLYVSKTASSKKSMTYISILTSDDRYIEYEMQILSDVIAPCLAKRLRSLFQPYLLTVDSEVVFSRNYDVQSPLYTYISFIQHHVQFNFRTVTTETVLRGIAAYHKTYLRAKGSKITKNMTNALWKKLIEHEPCPWITKNCDYQLQNMSKYRARDKKLVKLGVYYLVLKNYRNDIWRRGYQKKLQQQMTSEATLLQEE